MKREESPYTEHNLLAGSLESDTYIQNVPRDSKDPPSSPEMMLIWETTQEYEIESPEITQKV